MNAEYIKFHLKQILLDCHEIQRDKAIEWVIEYIKTIEKEKESWKKS